MPTRRSRPPTRCATTLGNDYMVALNLASTVPDWLETIGAKPMLLGLDLQGGVHFLMQVDQKAALDKRCEAYAEDIRVLLRDNRVRYASVERRADNSIVVHAARPTPTRRRRARPDRQATADRCSRSTARLPNQVAAAHPAGASWTRSATDAIEQNISTLRNRINELGVAEPIIQRQGSDRIVVQLPGVQDTAAGQAHPRRHRDAGIPRAWSKATPYDARDQRQRAAGSAHLLPRASWARTASRSGAAEQARDRLRRPAGQARTLGFDPQTARPAVSHHA